MCVYMLQAKVAILSMSIKCNSLGLLGLVTRDEGRVFNKIVLNRLNCNLKRLHDKMGGGNFFCSLTFKMVHSEAFLR
jgi:hypothetical protein